MLLLTKYTVLYKENEICCIILLSLPSRERGLKLHIEPIIYNRLLSLPSRERGLKWVNLKPFERNYSRSLRGSVD